jgi:hypothetical protein
VSTLAATASIACARSSDDATLVCHCFGISAGAIRREIDRTGRSSVASRIRREVKAGNCACIERNPSGRCCLGDVHRVVAWSSAGCDRSAGQQGT